VQNGLTWSDLASVTIVTSFALLQDFNSFCWHPSGKGICLTFALQKIGMAFKGFTISPAKEF
jgi:hypothetical protein